jgi:hypothetical protein
MPAGAHVTSVEGLEAFRANLVVYLSKARPALEEVGADVLRTRGWLQSDQRTFWEAQVRRRTKELDAAQQALFSASVSSLNPSPDAQKMAVHRAKRNLEEAQTKLKVVRQWAREFDNQTEPLTKQLDKLHTFLCDDMVKACAYLSEAIKALEAYAEVATPSPEGEPGSPAPAAPLGDAPAGAPPAAASNPEASPPSETPGGVL